MSDKLTRFMTAEEFSSAIIAQDGDDDYSTSGYVCVLLDGTAYIGSYSHCSCYDTFASLCAGGIGDYFSEGDASFCWSGSVAELVDMARRTADPTLPQRTAVEDDWDFDHLVEMYKQVLAWWDTLTPASGGR